MKKKAAPATRDDGWKGYVNWTPNTSDREKVVAYMGEKGYDPLDLILGLSESGYASTFSYDEKSACHRLSVTGRGEHCDNKGYTLSLRASTPERCVGLAGYYIYRICDGSRWLSENGGDDVW